MVRELWFIVVMTGVALLLLAVVLGVVLHKVRDKTVSFHSQEKERTQRHGLLFL